MDTKQLRYFCSVVENGSFSRAAEKEFVSQATISYNVALLEKELNLLLIDRNEKNFALTTAGIEYFNRAKKILNDLQNAEQEARTAQYNRDSTIRLGYFAHSFYFRMPAVLGALLQKNPGMHIELEKDGRGNLLQKLDRDELDGIFINEYGTFNPYGQLTKKCLYGDTVGILMRADHRLAKKEPLMMEDLKQDRLLILVEPENRRSLNERDYAQNEIQPVTSEEQVELLVKSGYGVAMIEGKTFPVLPEGLVLRMLEDYMAYDNIYFYWKKSNERKSLRQLIAILNETDWNAG